MRLLFDLFLLFLQIGAFTFGGGYAMLALVQQEVASRSWLSNEALLNFLAISESTPGSFAINIATYVGYHVACFLGALFATIAVVLPSFLLLLFLSKHYRLYQNNRYVKAAMQGIQPVVISLILIAALSVWTSIISFRLPFSPANLIAIVIIFLTFSALQKNKNPILLILISALLGMISGYFHLL